MDFTNSKVKGVLAAAVIVVVTAIGDTAAEPLYSGGDWVLGLNATRVFTSESLQSTTLAGLPVLGADVAITDDTTLTFDVSYFVNPFFAVNFYGGVPASASLIGKGSLAGLPIGETKYGPAILSLQFHPLSIHGLSPYLGVGVGRVLFLDEKDGALTNFNLNDAWAPALQAGLRFRLNENWLANFDVRYVPFKSHVSGQLGGAPVHAIVQVDPILVNVGVAFRF